MTDSEIQEYKDFKDILLDISDKLTHVKYKGDLSDIGNEIGIAIAKYIDKTKSGFNQDDFISGIKHGISLVDGTHGQPIPADNKFEEAVKYVQENYVKNGYLPYLLLGNVAELIEIFTGQIIDWNKLAIYDKHE